MAVDTLKTFDTRKLAAQLAAQLAEQLHQSPDPRSDPLLTPKMTAQQLNCCTGSVRNMIRAGKLKAVRVTARRLGIRQSEIDRHLRENK